MIQEIEKYYPQIIETLLVLFIWFIIRIILKRVIEKRFVLNHFSQVRKQFTIKTLRSLLNVLAVISVILIWSVDQSRVLLFLSSVVTILGVAFFAQWSHISNITSGIIIFFNSTTKIGDTIRILDKDFDLSGEILDIGPIFTKIKNSNGELISLPNNILLQKAVSIKDIPQE